ncbi:nuclear transport factor 2 family protein [Billgrantia gudaonensis]|uniref:SnoaL-like domain-containing protein n=1 Tax=Billgrantia gudaonensis TaxID=376427 RepID=A0A1G9C5W2_9GAMM|nr:nuclear transport factor 2 family protein [Halomonas gudaonensis]SDK47060.1 SnoaL-like domain-containing protein [Halomonas gudaonensis]
MSTDPALEAFCAFFNKLDKTYTNNLYKIYTEDVVFSDPLHHIEGRAALQRYFDTLYANVKTCRFAFHDRLHQGREACVTWTMHLEHPRLAGGQPFSVSGCSRLTFAADDTQRVCRHHDYFDVGAMLYERLPMLGPTIRWIKRRVGD